MKGICDLFLAVQYQSCLAAHAIICSGFADLPKHTCTTGLSISTVTDQVHIIP